MNRETDDGVQEKRDIEGDINRAGMEGGDTDDRQGKKNLEKEKR